MSIFSKIESLFGFDIRDFFLSYQSFVNSDLQNIISFYRGVKESSIEISQKNLKELTQLSEEILTKIEANKFSINSSEFYQILDEFEDIRLKLLTYSNIQKWVGFPNNKSVYGQQSSLEYTLSKNETIESASSRLGFSNADEGGLSLALSNSMKETDYTLEGGNIFQFNYQTGRDRVELDSVICKDLIGEELLGRDIDQNFSFDEDDLKVLEPRSTFNQTCSIVLSLKIGDNPEFPFDGIDKTILVNRVTSSISFPIILKQLNNSIYKEDTIKKMLLEDVWYSEDSLHLRCKLYSHISNLEGIYEN